MYVCMYVFLSLFIYIYIYIYILPAAASPFLRRCLISLPGADFV